MMMSSGSDEDVGKSIQNSEVSDNDVLLGRGAGIRQHEGNRRFQKLIRASRDEYYDCREKLERDEVAYKVIRVVQSNGGRFLKKVSTVKSKESVWQVIDKRTIMEKTKQAFRDSHKTTTNSPSAETARRPNFSRDRTAAVDTSTTDTSSQQASSSTSLAGGATMAHASLFNAPSLLGGSPTGMNALSGLNLTSTTGGDAMAGSSNPAQGLIQQDQIRLLGLQREAEMELIRENLRLRGLLPVGNLGISPAIRQLLERRRSEQLLLSLLPTTADQLRAPSATSLNNVTGTAALSTADLAAINALPDRQQGSSLQSLQEEVLSSRLVQTQANTLQNLLAQSLLSPLSGTHGTSGSPPRSGTPGETKKR